MHEPSLITDRIDEKLDDLYGGSLEAMILSTVSEKESYARQNANAKKQYIHTGEVHEVPEECDEQVASQGQYERKEKSIDLEDDRLLASSTQSADVSPAPTHIEEFDCLLESRSQKIVQLMLDSPVPEDEFGEDDLEILDVPFLSTFDLEIEMKRANFAPEDLWYGFKV